MSNRNRKKEREQQTAPKPRRFIPDIHGMADEFEEVAQDAISKGLYIEQLGDMIDHGFDSAAALTKMLDIREAGLGDFLMANHEWKHVRGFRNMVRYGKYKVQYRDEQEVTKNQIEATDGLRDRFLKHADTMHFWKRIDEKVFIVHASYHEEMETAVPFWPMNGRNDSLLVARAIYGQTNGLSNPDGTPVRLYNWVADVPEGQIVIVGHDIQSTEYITRYTNKSGGQVYFADLGCGKHNMSPVYLDYIDGEISTPFPVVDLEFYA